MATAIWLPPPQSATSPTAATVTTGAPGATLGSAGEASHGGSGRESGAQVGVSAASTTRTALRMREARDIVATAYVGVRAALEPKGHSRVSRSFYDGRPPAQRTAERLLLVLALSIDLGLTARVVSPRR